jgi:hypothetical protein
MARRTSLLADTCGGHALDLEYHRGASARHKVTRVVVGRALEGLAPKAFSFASGFVILGTLWIGHRRATREPDLLRHDPAPVLAAGPF